MSAPASIGILGGTFDPVHRGHLSIARSFLESGEIGELWVLLTPSPPHKGRDSLTDYDIRLEMLQAAFSAFDHVTISDLESHLPSPSYTWRTLSRLRNEYPDHRFSLCLGEDSFAQFTSWKKWREIVRRHPILVAERPGNVSRVIPDELRRRTSFISHDPVEISSTEVRSAVDAGEEVSRWLPDGVLAIIRSHELYTSEPDGQP